MSETVEDFMDRLYRESYKQRYDKDEYVERLERELEERLRVNVGLATENKQLREALAGRETTE